MAITPGGAAASIVDNTSQDDSAARAVTPPSTTAGDLVFAAAFVRHGSESLSIANTGGQSWANGTLRQNASYSLRIFWCRFNGTWASNPTFQSDTSADLRAIAIGVGTFHPTTGSNTWAIDVAEASLPFSAPTSPFDITAPGRTTVAASTVTIAVFISGDDNQYELQGGGWTNLGNAQYRNTYGSQTSMSLAYKILTSAGPTGDCTNRQTTNGGDQGRWLMITFKEQSSGVTITDAADELFYDGETGITVTGTSFGATQGAGEVIISPTDDVNDGSAVNQTVTSWGDTSIQFTADLASFGFFTDLYLFVKDNSGTSNSSGRVVQRQRRLQIQETLKSLAGAAVTSLSSIKYRIETTLNGIEIYSADDGATDGSGDFESAIVALAADSPLAGGGDVVVSWFHPGSGASTSKGSVIQTTPVYL